MAYKDPEKAREYDRLRKRKARAEAKLGGIRSGPSTRRIERELTVERRREVSPLMPADLDGFDTKLLAFGNRALELAAAGLEHVEPDRLEPIDIKRLAEVGVALRNLAAEALEKREATTVTERTILSETILSDPEALDHVHALLALSARDDLARTFEPPSEREATQFSPFLGDPGMLREDG